MKLYVKIEGISCHNCEITISNALKSMKNIKDIEFQGDIAIITYTGKISNKKVIDAIIRAGYITKEEYISNDIKDLTNNIKLLEFIFISIFIILIIFLINKIFGFNVFNAIPTINSNITYGMLIITGLLTSIHCISMCGAINLMAVVNQNTKRSFKKPILYNLGRVISYTLIGGIVGLVGRVLSVNNQVSGLIILIAALIMLLMSLNMLGVLKLKRKHLFNIRIKAKNSFVIGLLNGLMPCGPMNAMQVYALSTGSFINGALSMFLFAIGTVPLMLFTGIILNFVKGKGKVLINKIASVLMLLLALVMINRSLLYFNIDIFKVFNNYDNFLASYIDGDIQVVEFDLTYDNYQDIILQKDIPVKMIIHVDKNNLTGCNNEILIQEYNIKQKLIVGDNVIEFTPRDTKEITYTCWMNMIKNTIKVIDDQDYFREAK